MSRSTGARWRRVALVATAVLLSTAVATGAGALDSVPAPTLPTATAEAPPAAAPAPSDDVTAPETSPPETSPPETAPPDTSPPETADPDASAPDASAPEPPPAVVDDPAPSTEPVESAPPDGDTGPTSPADPAPPGQAGGTPASQEEHEDHDGPTILVNGQPFKGEADPKLDGCAVTLSVAGLDGGAHVVAGAIRAGEPSGDATLVSIDAAFDGTGWSETWALDDLVGDLVQKPNGYRIRIDLAIDGGASQTSRPFWLACGADQSGNPFVVVIDKEWRDAEGEPLDDVPPLPEGWAITASSQLGDARCTYPDGGDELVCEYDNRGSHQGSEDGLYVPGGKGKTFEVSETALPDGWTNVSGLGTFVAREVCPGGGHEHEEDRAHEGEEEERPPCAWTVVNQALPEEPTVPSEPTVPEEPTTPSVPTVPEAPQPPDGVDVASAGASAPARATAGADALARTGSSSDVLVITALALFAAGAVAVAARRRMLARPPA